MQDKSEDLGRLISTHPISPAYVQRAAFLAVLSFSFFLAMLIGFYVRQNLGYFLLATAFMIVYIVTMFSLFSQRRAAVNIFEDGIRYKKFSGRWSELTASETTDARSGRPRITLTDDRGRTARLPDTVVGSETMIKNVRDRARKAG